MRSMKFSVLFWVTNLAVASTEPVIAPADTQVAPAVTSEVAQVETTAQTTTESPPVESALESQLEEFQMPANVAPASVAQERLYSVQSRFSPLKSRSEVTLGGAYNFKGNGFLTMSSVNLDYRFHFNDRWSLNLGGAYAFNSLSSSGEQLVHQEGHAPDVSFPKYKGHLLLGFNTFYGKIRTSMDSNAYFDQYIAIGPGMIWTDNGNSISGIADVGLAFWLKKWGSLRVGVMNEFYTEKRLTASATVHHVIGHVDFGMMFGGGVE